MKEERMAILKMVEEGKISTDDAVKLLDSIAAQKKSSGFDEKINKAARSMDCFAKEVKEKVSEAAKDFEPKVKNTAKIIVEKTTAFVDELSQALKDVGEKRGTNENEEKHDEVLDNYDNDGNNIVNNDNNNINNN